MGWLASYSLEYLFHVDSPTRSSNSLYHLEAQKLGSDAEICVCHLCLHECLNQAEVRSELVTNNTERMAE